VRRPPACTSVILGSWKIVVSATWVEPQVDSAHFVMGFIMTCAGAYFLADRVTVVGSHWSFYGGNSFGITLIPLLIGVGLLFWNGRSIPGWLLTCAERFSFLPA